jgi:hypothetical protein
MNPIHVKTFVEIYMKDKREDYVDNLVIEKFMAEEVSLPVSPEDILHGLAEMCVEHKLKALIIREGYIQCKKDGAL